MKIMKVQIRIQVGKITLTRTDVSTKYESNRNCLD